MLAHLFIQTDYDIVLIFFNCSVITFNQHGRLNVIYVNVIHVSIQNFYSLQAMQNSFFDNGMIGEEEKYIVYCYLIQNLARKNLMKVTSITQVFYLIGKSSEQQSSKICKILQQSQFFCVRGAKIDCLRFEVIKLLDHISDRIKPRNCALSEFLLQFFFQFLYIMCKKYFILY